MRFECAEIVCLETKPVGLFKVARDGAEWKLVQIVLAPEIQGQGLGTSLINRLIAEARANGATLSLSVLKSNPALTLYKRLGFVVVGEEEHAYEMRHRAQAFRPSASEHSSHG